MNETWFVKSKRAQNDTDYETWIEGTVTPTLNGFDQGDSRAVVLVISSKPIGFNWQNGGGYGKAHDGLGITEDGVGPLSCSQVPAVAYNKAVRRITPIEAERLQGFPDNYTRIPWRGKPAEDCPDGPRYKALGNSMAVPVIRWIGNRIQRCIL